jgi:SNF family Na+-dependent transporter
VWLTGTVSGAAFVLLTVPTFLEAAFFTAVFFAAVFSAVAVDGTSAAGTVVAFDFARFTAVIAILLPGDAKGNVVNTTVSFSWDNLVGKSHCRRGQIRGPTPCGIASSLA